ncbi:MAG: hypothetical protein ACTSYE_05700, partial [Alphaproteobacteria bacterium]
SRAAEAFMGWAKPPEIIPRRRREQALFRDGTYVADGHATVYRADEDGAVLTQSGDRVNVAGLLAGNQFAGTAEVDGPPKKSSPIRSYWLWTFIALAAVAVAIGYVIG